MSQLNIQGGVIAAIMARNADVDSKMPMALGLMSPAGNQMMGLISSKLLVDSLAEQNSKDKQIAELNRKLNETSAAKK